MDCAVVLSPLDYSEAANVPTLAALLQNDPLTFSFADYARALDALLERAGRLFTRHVPSEQAPALQQVAKAALGLQLALAGLRLPLFEHPPTSWAACDQHCRDVLGYLAEAE